MATMIVSRTRRAFTLVELLVVVTIIAVLMTLLIPALMKAKEQAMEAACSSNLRSIGLWGTMYASDWEGVLPTTGSTDHNWSYWWLAPTSWIEKTDWASSDFNKRGKTILYCPKAFRAMIRDSNAWWTEWNTDYGQNPYLGGYWDIADGVSPPQPDYKPKDNLLTVNKYWFAEIDATSSQWSPHGLRNGSYGTHFYAPWMWERGLVEPWGPRCQNGTDALSPVGQGHPGNSANFVYGDAHVENLKWNFWGSAGNVIYDNATMVRLEGSFTE